MRQLKRNECAILPLVLKGKWYDMIASGEKKEEYRDAKIFWEKRIENILRHPNSIIIAFSRGYKKQDMFFICDGIRLMHESTKSGRRKVEWGEPETPHFVIQLGERVELVD